MIRLSEEAVGVKAAGTCEQADARAGGAGVTLVSGVPRLARTARVACRGVRPRSWSGDELPWCVLCGAREAVGVVRVRASTDRWNSHVYCTTSGTEHSAQRDEINTEGVASVSRHVPSYGIKSTAFWASFTLSLPL